MQTYCPDAGNVDNIAPLARWRIDDRAVKQASHGDGEFRWLPVRIII
jgi:hypothetical protein